MQKTQTITPEEAYLKAAVELENARNAYDHEKGNSAFNRVMTAARQIRLTNPDGGERFFASLLANEMLHVVRLAAFNLIPLNPELARKTYEALAKSESSEVSFDAEMTLKEWKAGRLDPDWFMKE